MFGSLAFYVAATCAEIIFYLFTYSTDKVSYGAQAILKRVVCLSPPYQTCLFCLKSAFLSALICAFIYWQHPPPSSRVHTVPGTTVLQGPSSLGSTQLQFLPPWPGGSPRAPCVRFLRLTFCPPPTARPEPALQPPTISVGVHLAEDLFCPFLWG